MPFSLRRDSETRPSQKSSQIARCFLRSISTAVLRPFSSVTNWIPVILLLSLPKKYHPPTVPRPSAPVKAGGSLHRSARPEEEPGLCSADTPVRVFAVIPPSARRRVTALHDHPLTPETSRTHRWGQSPRIPWSPKAWFATDR